MSGSKIIQSLEENSNKRKAIIPYLQWIETLKKKLKLKHPMKVFSFDSYIACTVPHQGINQDLPQKVPLNTNTIE